VNVDSTSTGSHITRLLEEWQDGNSQAAEILVSKTYNELRRIARLHLRGERPGHTLQATALLHEAYLRLLDHVPESIDSRQAFFRLMSAEMRRRLIDHARRRMADKRGAGAHPVSLDSVDLEASVSDNEAQDMLDRLDAALERLTAAYPRTASVVQLRYLAGLTLDETASELGLSTGTVKREWTFAKAWLAAALDANDPSIL
jgi:RNA polymerase sigma factor (TIGR02999 family)